MATGENRTNNDALIELAVKAAGEAKGMTLEAAGMKGVPAIILPQHMRLESVKKLIDEWRPNPERKKGTARVLELESFIDHVNRFKDASSVLFASPEGTTPTLTAVFNYNEGATVGGDVAALKAAEATAQTVATLAKREGIARWGDHRVVYTFPLSDEWKAWNEKDGEKMDQEDFARFIEDRLLDVGATPTGDSKEFATQLGVAFATPQKLLELSRGLEVHVGQKVQASVKLGSGEGQIRFVEEHADAAGQPLNVPGAFLVQVPIFKAGEVWQIPARLRYRVQGQAVEWWYDLYRTDRAFQIAFDEVLSRGRMSTALPLFIGSQES